MEERKIKNYKDSDYALNKFSKGIVYRFADRVIEITLQDYLAETPGRTVQDFEKLKTLSDEIYHQQVMQQNRTSRLDLSISGLEDTGQLASVPLDAELIHKSDGKRAMEAARRLLDSDELTEIQRRRFIMHFFKGVSYRQIAEIEGVFFTSVADSVTAATRKLKKYFKNF